jgi:RHS repeat-associated protein
MVLLVGLVPATLHAGAAPTYGAIDAGTDLARSYVGARCYSSVAGRFTTVDPVLDVDQALVDPQRWNRYTYALNNPLRYVDPDGRQAWVAWVHNILNSPQPQRMSQRLPLRARI